jgi:phosphoribosylamine--glycine ligase
VNLPEDTSLDELLDLIGELNADPGVHGILVQLPLPGQLDESAVIAAIAPLKDVDAFHRENVGAIMLGEEGFLPCTPAGVMELLREYGIPVEGKECVVIGRSNIVGKPMAMLLLHANGTVTVCHSKTKSLAEMTRRADILVCAIGRAGFITGDMVKPGAVVIDVGMNRDENGKLCGDVDFPSVSAAASYITPVPGGVGPMTRAMLLQNTVYAAERSHPEEGRRLDILVVGGGGREHAIINKLAESRDCGRIYAAPGNGGIGAIAECTGIKPTDFDVIEAFALSHKIDYVVVAPDDPLVMGLVDRLAAAGIPAFGPTKAAARIEGSKVFSKGLMKRYHIPTAAYETFRDMEDALAYLDRRQDFPVVVKADGLALGKGVIIARTREEAKEAVRSMMLDKRFGDSGSQVVIEEFLTGPEVSVLAFADGKTIVPMVSAMDHKRALTGDLGPNTGGMGTVAPNPFYTGELAELCMQTIYLPTMEAMRAEGCPFQGCLFIGLMLTPKGPKVIEYNCRFGDPEAQVVLPLLRGDLLRIMQACTNGTLEPYMVSAHRGAAACVIMASGGYPDSYRTGYEISGLGEASKLPGVYVYHAGTKGHDDRFLSAGGRVLGVTAKAGSLPAALESAYAAVGKIFFADAYYRTDIGEKACQLTVES